MAGLLDEKAIKQKLCTYWCGQNYIYFDEVGSTNEMLKQWLATGKNLPAGTVVLANYQSKGRGRLERRWEAPAGTSLTFSILFRPFWLAEKCNWLTMLASVAIVKTIDKHTPLTAKIKWPNDIVIKVEENWCKVAGLLLETNLDADGRCQSAVLGMGINLNIARDQLPDGITPAASLLSASGLPVPRQPFLLDLLAGMEKRYELAEKGRSPQFEWQQYMITIGQSVIVTNHGTSETITGTAVATDEWGQLLVKAEDGRRHTIAAGDVTLRH